MSVRVRIAPSPTGDPHVGTAYIALFNLIFARHFKGQFILRIEDTDQSRSRPEYEKSIIDALHWCNITWDEGPDVGGPYAPYRQSERTAIYKKHAYELLEKGKAYKCFATAEELTEMREVSAAQGKKQGYDRRYRNLSAEEIRKREDAGQPFVIRMKVHLTGECVYDDKIKGKVTVPWADVDDQVILKSDGYPTYHLANIVDDHLMKITHVIRGDEWMSSTPKHVFLYEAFGWTAPDFLHMPLLLGKDGKKLSKRKNPTSIFYFRDSGYLSESLVNYLTHMGYSMQNAKEDYTLAEITESFDPKRIGTSGAFFDVQKLNWLNQKKVRESIPVDQLWPRISDWMFNDEFMRKIMPLIHSRIGTFSSFMEQCDFFFIQDLRITPQMLVPKDATPDLIASIFQVTIWSLDKLEDWSGVGLEKTINHVAQLFDVNMKKIVIPCFFIAIMGRNIGPPLYDSVTLLGKDRTRVRFMAAIELLGGISGKKMSILTKAWEKGDCKGIGAAPAS
jgi:glutamyl-tRNA synthetase